ncbi:hypothetical protein BC835DRAFT_1414327 [Cytidiella melzeri]|nr:hypothetical protein BC835DRAFT_1414327 [Cytidiella melzeri]
MSSISQGDSDPNAATARPDTEEATDTGLDPYLELTEEIDKEFFTECLLADLKTYPVTSKRMFKKTTLSQPSELQKSAEWLLVSW